MSAHTPTPWSYEEWATSGPTAAAAMTIEQSMRLNEFAVPMTRVCQAKGTGKQVVAIALGNTQEEADGNAALIVVATNACAGMSDPEARIAALRACEQEQGQFLVEMVRERDALRAERDAIAAELEYAIDQMLRHDFGTLSVVPRLRAALARSAS